MAKLNAKQVKHPHSRQALYVQRSAGRINKLEKAKKIRDKDRDLRIKRAVYFKLVSQANDYKPMDNNDIKEAIEKYVCRYDNEIEVLVKERRLGRPKTKKQENLETVVERERNEFKSGYLLPDLMDKETCRLLSTWSGDYDSISLLKFTRIAKDD